MTGLTGDSAACQVCGRPYVPVNKDGRVRAHREPGSDVRCPGSNRMVYVEQPTRTIGVGWRHHTVASGPPRLIVPET